MTISTERPPVPRTHADFHRASRRATCRLLVRTAATITLFAAAGLLGWLTFVTFSETDGPVRTNGTEGNSFSMVAGHTGFWGQTVIFNTGSTDAMLKDIRPVDPPAGLEIVDILIAGPKRKLFSMSGGPTWPDDALTDLQPVRGATIPPAAARLGDRGVEIVVVVRPTRPGRYVITKLDVTYRVGRRDHRRTVVAVLSLCARTRVTDENLACHLPELPSA